MRVEARLGDIIKHLRGKKGLTQVDLAEKVGLTVSALDDIENNKRPVSAVRLSRISEALDVSSDMITSNNSNSIQTPKKNTQDSPKLGYSRLDILLSYNISNKDDKLISVEVKLDEEYKIYTDVKDKLAEGLEFKSVVKFTLPNGEYEELHIIDCSTLTNVSVVRKKNKLRSEVIYEQ